MVVGTPELTDRTSTRSPLSPVRTSTLSSPSWTIVVGVRRLGDHSAEVIWSRVPALLRPMTTSSRKLVPSTTRASVPEPAVTSTVEPEESRVATTTRSSPRLRVDVRRAVPAADRAGAAGHGQHTVEVADQEGVVAGTAGQAGGLEDRQAGHRVEQALHGAAGEPGARRATQDRADDQQAVAEEEVAVEALHEGVGAAGVGERVGAVATGDDVVTETAVDRVVVARADDRVVACTGTQHQRDQVGGHARVRGGAGRGVDRVAATQGVDDERVALGADPAHHVDAVREGGGQAGRLDALGRPGRRGTGPQAERVRPGVRALDGHRVGGPVVGVPDVRHLVGEAAAGDGLLAGSVHRGDAAQVDGEALGRRGVQVVDQQGVAAGAEVDADVLDPEDRLVLGRARGGALELVVHPQVVGDVGGGGVGVVGAQRDLVVGGREGDVQRVGAAAAVDAQRGRHHAGERDDQGVVVGAAVVDAGRAARARRRRPRRTACRRRCCRTACRCRRRRGARPRWTRCG